MHALSSFFMSSLHQLVLCLTTCAPMKMPLSYKVHTLLLLLLLLLLFFFFFFYFFFLSPDTTRNWTQGYLVFYVVDTPTKSFNKCRGVLGMVRILNCY